jgi:adenylyltransferase/sulfurtransferase
MIAERLARAGVGTLRIVDRDWVEVSNLPRQTLFTEQDAVLGRPKAIAAADALGAIDSRLHIEPLVADLTCDNIHEFADGCDVLLDGTDNFETRFLLNDYSLSKNVPWVHGGCLGASGQVMTIIPGKSACFRCLVRDLPPRDSMETCDSAGVLGPAIGVIACWQAAEAIKILSGNVAAVSPDLMVIDTWNTACRMVSLASLKSPLRKCPACQLGEFPFLEGELRTETVVLCGKNAVQVNSASAYGFGNFATLVERLKHSGKVVNNGFFLRLTLPKHVLTVFRDGRAVVEGTTDPLEAKNLLSKTLGG